MATIRQRRFERKMRRREMALRETALNTLETELPELTESPERLEVTILSTEKDKLVCDYCKYKFHSYGRLLNHHCGEDRS